MEATHIVFDREYKVGLPDYSNIEKYRKLISELPDLDANKILQQIEDAYLEFYCKWGCHSFLVYPKKEKGLPRLQNERGAYREIAYNTNYEEELNIMLFTDALGDLSQVTVFFGVGNVQAIPDNLKIISLKGIWTSNV